MKLQLREPRHRHHIHADFMEPEPVLDRPLGARTLAYLRGERTAPVGRGWRPLRDTEVNRTEGLAIPTTWKDVDR